MTNKQIIYLSVYFIFSICIFLYTDMSYLAKLSLIVFVLSLGLYLLSNMPAGLSSFIAIMIGILLGLPEDVMFHSMNSHVVWLMIGAFIISAAIEISGLLNRMINFINVRCKTSRSVNILLFLIIQVISVIVPSTSGRAAAMLPVYKAFETRFPTNKKYFALLIPILILMGANLTLIGAGSHLVGIGLLEGKANKSISYREFLLWGLPFGLVIGLVTFIVTKIMYMNISEDVLYHQEKSHEERKPFTQIEKRAIVYIVITITLWMTENIHGFEIAFITMLMGICMMLPRIGVITWKQGVQNVSWSLIFFVAGATTLGNLLVTYKVVDYIQDHLLNYLSQFQTLNEFAILSIIVIITVTSHLYITSHTTRAIVFVPVFLLFSEMFNLNPVAVVFITLIGTNYCVTFPVCSKALLLFYEQEEKPFKNRDLMKISVILMPTYILLMIFSYYIWWQFTGLSLR